MYKFNRTIYQQNQGYNIPYQGQYPLQQGVYPGQERFSWSVQDVRSSQPIMISPKGSLQPMVTSPPRYNQRRWEDISPKYQMKSITTPIVKKMPNTSFVTDTCFDDILNRFSSTFNRRSYYSYL